MLNKIISSIAVLAVLSVLLIFGSEADATSYIPIFLDEIVACVHVDGDVWVAPTELTNPLQNYTGEVATIMPMAQVIDELALAGTGCEVRFEGGYAAGDTVVGLEAKGYDSMSTVTPVVHRSGGASVWSD
jgi:hypothetical protein